MTKKHTRELHASFVTWEGSLALTVCGAGMLCVYCLAFRERWKYYTTYKYIVSCCAIRFKCLKRAGGAPCHAILWWMWHLWGVAWHAGCAVCRCCCVCVVCVGVGTKRVRASIFASRKVVDLHNLIEPRAEHTRHAQKVRCGVRCRQCVCLRMRRFFVVVVVAIVWSLSASWYTILNSLLSNVPASRFMVIRANHVVSSRKCLAPQSHTPTKPTDNTIHDARARQQ